MSQCLHALTKGCKMGRPQKPYRTSWGELVDGLYKTPDGRWKIVATGERFTEKHEFTAVTKFKQRATDRSTIFVPARLEQSRAQGWNIVGTIADVTPPDTENELGQTGHLIDEQAMREMVR
jgi:hypothetical protein